jgi:hypothetical protein
VGRTKRITTLACAGLLLAAKAQADDRGPKEMASACPSTTEREAGSDGPTHPEESSAQESKQKEENRKRRFFRSWLQMAAKTQAKQPDWLSPLATTSGRLKQELRYDIWDQPTAQGNRTYQFGGGKGLEFITSSRTQVLAGIPSYILRSPNGPPGGFGASAPTGSHGYGAGNAVLTPTLAFGKGFGRFDVQSTVGVNLPAGATAKLGRQLQWNTAFQYQTAWKLWPELEANSTFYKTGPNAGDKQVFLTPGLGFGRVRLRKGFRFSSAAGLQIAVTKFHTYDHRWMFSERVSF